jgi:hypothetical protein
MKTTAIVSTSVLLLLTADVADARSVNPKHLEAVDPPVEYRLGQDVVIQGQNILYTVRAGRYVLRYRDRRGSYFLGEGNCLHLDIRTPKMTGTNDWECGLHVPDDSRRGATFFRVRPVTPTQAEMGLVVNQIIRYNHGSFDWPDKAESMELRAQLAPVAPP